MQTELSSCPPFQNSESSHLISRISFFFLNDPATPEFYPLPLHAALPISRRALIGHDHPPYGVLPASDARQPHTYCQVSVHLSRWKQRRRTLAAPRELRQVGHFSLRQRTRSEEHTSELQSPCNLVCRLLLE